MRFPTKCCINGVNFVRLLLLSTELFKFEIQKYGQILCVHKPYFLMPGHIYSLPLHAVAINAAPAALQIFEIYIVVVTGTES